MAESCRPALDVRSRTVLGKPGGGYKRSSDGKTCSYISFTSALTAFDAMVLWHASRYTFGLTIQLGRLLRL